VTDPPVVLLDEPTASLDPIARASITEVLCDLVAQGLTIVATSHTAADIGSPFGRLILMADGAIAYDGDPGEFLSDEHDDPVAAQFARALRVR
jgi:ABC-type multidrug transport system ATPase subunit